MTVILVFVSTATATAAAEDPGGFCCNMRASRIRGRPPGISIVPEGLLPLPKFLPPFLPNRPPPLPRPPGGCLLPPGLLCMQPRAGPFAGPLIPSIACSVSIAVIWYHIECDISFVLVLPLNFLIKFSTTWTSCLFRGVFVVSHLAPRL